MFLMCFIPSTNDSFLLGSKRSASLLESYRGILPGRFSRHTLAFRGSMTMILTNIRYSTKFYTDINTLLVILGQILPRSCVGFLGRSVLFVAMTASPFWCRVLSGPSSAPLPLTAFWHVPSLPRIPSLVDLRSFTRWLYSQRSSHQNSWFSLSHHYY